MAMSDCINCWETPCSCGYDYLKYNTVESIDEKIKLLQAVKEVKLKYPNVKDIKVLMAKLHEQIESEKPSSARAKFIKGVNENESMGGN